MSRNQSWPSTNTRYELMLVLWEKMRQGGTDDGIAKWATSHEGDKVLIPGTDQVVQVVGVRDRSTVKKVRGDLEAMPSSMVSGLPKSILSLRIEMYQKRLWGREDSPSDEDFKTIFEVWESVALAKATVGIKGKDLLFSKQEAASVLKASKAAPGMGSIPVYWLAHLYMKQSEGQIGSHIIDHFVEFEPWLNENAEFSYRDSLTGEDFRVVFWLLKTLADDKRANRLYELGIRSDRDPELSRSLWDRMIEL